MDVEKLIVKFAKQKIYFNAVKITNDTNIMFKILSAEYEKVMKCPIGIGELGKATDSFNLFVSGTVKESISKSTANNN